MLVVTFEGKHDSDFYIMCDANGKILGFETPGDVNIYIMNFNQAIKNTNSDYPDCRWSCMHSLKTVRPPDNEYLETCLLRPLELYQVRSLYGVVFGLKLTPYGKYQLRIKLPSSAVGF